jgi:hypothetical protein
LNGHAAQVRQAQRIGRLGRGNAAGARGRRLADPWDLDCKAVLSGLGYGGIDAFLLKF